MLIAQGHANRNQDMWSATRWQTYHIMGCLVDLKKAHIHSVTDLMEFPWERIKPTITKEDIKEMADELDAINAMNSKNSGD